MREGVEREEILELGRAGDARLCEDTTQTPESRISHSEKVRFMVCKSYLSEEQLHEKEKNIGEETSEAREADLAGSSRPF